MNHHETHEEKPIFIPKFGSYVIGYFISILLTLVAFKLASHQMAFHSTDASLLASLFILLALAQLFVQVIFFLHLSTESKHLWNTIVFGFAVFFVLTVVVGSLWVMSNLRHGLHKDMFMEENIPPGALGH